MLNTFEIQGKIYRVQDLALYNVLNQLAGRICSAMSLVGETMFDSDSADVIAVLQGLGRYRDGSPHTVQMRSSKSTKIKSVENPKIVISVNPQGRIAPKAIGRKKVVETVMLQGEYAHITIEVV